MNQLDERAIRKVSGPAWRPLKEAFLQISEDLLAVSEDAVGELTTIYVKYCCFNSGRDVYAVVWLKSSKYLVVGLSLPDDFDSPGLGDAPTGMQYSGLTKYFILSPGGDVPSILSEWAKMAYKTRLAASKSASLSKTQK